jgi:hypothetical protein
MWMISTRHDKSVKPKRDKQKTSMRNEKFKVYFVMTGLEKKIHEMRVSDKPIVVGVGKHEVEFLANGSVATTQIHIHLKKLLHSKQKTSGEMTG